MTADLTKGKPLPVIFRFSLPVIAGNLFQLFYTLADTIIVGQTMGEKALSAVGATTVFVYFILCFIQGLANGFAIILGHCAGRHDEKQAKYNIAASVYISIAVAFVITVITCLLVPSVVKWMKVPQDISHDAQVYLMVIQAGTAATVLYNLISNILRALGDSRMPLIFLVFSSLLNIILDYVFIVPCAMGVGGAAFATVLSQLLSGVLCVVFAFRKYDLLHLGKNDWKIRPDYILSNLRLGFVMGFQMSVMCIGQIVMQSCVNKLGTEAIAGYTAASKVDQLSVLVNNAFMSAIASYVAQNYGAGDMKRIRNGVWSSLFLTECTNFIMIVLILIIEPYIVPMFVSSASPEVYSYASDFFLITLPFYPVLGLLAVYRTSVQSMGNTWAPFTACIVELVARCGASVILGGIFGYSGIVFSSPLAWIGADLVVIPVCMAMTRKNRE